MAETLILNDSSNINIINIEDTSSNPYTMPKSMVASNDNNVMVLSTPIQQKDDNETLQTTKTIEFDGVTETIKVSNLVRKGSVTLSGKYLQNTLDIPKYDISSITSVNDPEVDFNFVLAIRESENDANPKLYTSSKFYNTLISLYNVNPIYVNYVVDAEHIILVDLAPIKQKIKELRASELTLDLSLTDNTEKKYVQVDRNIFEYSNYKVTSFGELEAEPTYDYIELLKYISWIVKKPSNNYDDRLIAASSLGDYGGIEKNLPSETQPSSDITNTPPTPTQYPPIGRAGVEDEEEVFFNGKLYSWLESSQKWELQSSTGSGNQGGR